jgi:hypothetical protein
MMKTQVMMRMMKMRNSQLLKKKMRMQAPRVTTQTMMMMMICQIHSWTVRMSCLRRDSAGSRWRDKLRRMIDALLSGELARMCRPDNRLHRLRGSLLAGDD